MENYYSTPTVVGTKEFTDRMNGIHIEYPKLGKGIMAQVKEMDLKPLDGKKEITAKMLEDFFNTLPKEKPRNPMEDMYNRMSPSAREQFDKAIHAQMVRAGVTINGKKLI